MLINPHLNLSKIQPYTPGEKPIGGNSKGIKLSANESALGASPQALIAYSNAAENIERYPDANAVTIRNAIGDRYGLPIEKLLMGIGSDEILSVLVRCFSGRGDEVLFPTCTFPLYKIYTLAAGASVVQAPDKNYCADVDSLLTHVTPRTKIVIIANPNNPTGTYLSKDELNRLRKGLAEDILLIIDAAYSEYVAEDDYANGVSLVDDAPNTVMTRTFSKVHGLAGLRLGWCYADPDIISIVGKIRSPFNVSIAAQEAAIGAIQDLEHEKRVVEHTRKWHDIMCKRFISLGLKITGTQGNFLCVGFNEKAVIGSDSIHKFLRDNNIFVRHMRAFGLPNHLRITIGLEEELNSCIDMISQFITDSRKR